MAEKPSSIAIIALCLSIVSLGFSGYQWWNCQSEARIAAAIEVSKKAASMSRDEVNKLSEAEIALFKGRQLDAEQATMIYWHIEETEYLAYLINRNKIDLDYLSVPVKCGIYVDYKLVPKFQTIAKFADRLTEMETFSG